MLRQLWVGMLSVLTLALVLLASASGAAARVPQGFVGVVLDGPMFPDTARRVDIGQQLDVMVASGVESVRVAINWGNTQPYKSSSDVPAEDQNQFDEGADVGGVPTRWAAIDWLVSLAASRGITVLPEVLNAPGWDAIRQHGLIATPPARIGPYTNFLMALVRRYGPNGTLWNGLAAKRPIRMWQIWNEPNILGYWPIQPFAPSYVGLLRAAHAAIKSVDPGAKVVLAGMVNDSPYYLAQIYKVRGARTAFDVAAVHPYTHRPGGVITLLNDFRKTMNAHGDRHKPLLVTEVGWTSSLGKSSSHFGVETTEAGQAKNWGALFPLLMKNRGRLGLIGFDYYDWAGDERPGGPEFDYAGLFRFSAGRFAAKPVYSVFRRDALAAENCRKKSSLATSCLSPG